MEASGVISKKDTSSTNGISNGDKTSTMNIRSLAQEAAHWYFDRLDPHNTHLSNVKVHLRGPIIAVTARILQETHILIEQNAVAALPAAATPSPISSTTEKKQEEVEKPKSWKGCFRNFADASFSLQDLFELDDAEMTYEDMNSRNKARLDSFIEGVALALVSDEQHAPPMKEPPQRQVSVDSTDLSLIEGLVGFRSMGIGNRTATMNVVSSIKKATRSTSVTGVPKLILPKPLPQLGENELVTRIELYLRAILRVVTYANDCVIVYEPIKALKVRTKFIVAAFVNTVGTVRHVNPVLTRLLVALTKELLAVPTLSEGLMRIIRNIVSNYVHATSFASLAFLSSPESSADQRLTPAILEYTIYLQKNWQSCERDCDIELMLSTVIEPQLRNMYKTAEFQSIGHLLEVYQSHRELLQNIEIPPRVDRQSEVDRISQAMKDIPREVIAVNGSVLPRITNRFDLIQLLTSALNIRPIYTEGKNARHRRRGNKKKKSPTKLYSDDTDVPARLSGNEADVDSNYMLSESSMDDTDDGLTDDTTRSTSSATIARRKFPTTAVVDLLTKRLLLAVSRSGTMGMPTLSFVTCLVVKMSKWSHRHNI
jgi:hypothetical protein